MAMRAESRRIWRVVIVVVVLLIAANLMILAARQHSGDVVAQLPTDVVAISPESQNIMRPQDTVSVQLRSGLQGQLFVNGGAIPADQITGDPGLGQLQFRPGCANTGVSRSDCQYQEFDPGTITFRVEWWPADETLEKAKTKKHLQSYAWNATVG
jgi:hypothetical protein